MNKMKFLLVCSAALAAGISLADTTPNGVTPFDQLKLTDKTAFSAIASSGLTSATLTPAEPTIESGYYMLEGELTDTTAALAMAANGVEKTDIEQFTIEFKAGFADISELDTAKTQGVYTDAKIGFALTSGTTARYFNGTSWVAFNVFTEVAEGDDVTLTVDFDGRQNKARFTLDEEVLKVGTDEAEWVSVGAIGSNTIKAFGAGAVKSLAGLTRTITAEIVPITPSGETKAADIAFTPTQMGELAEVLGVDPADSTAVAEALNTRATKNNQTKLVNYILYGDASDNCAEEPRVEGVPLASESGNVAVKIANFKPHHTVDGATVKYQLQGSETGASGSWVNVGGAVTTPTLEFSNETNYRYFKVLTTIEYREAK